LQGQRARSAGAKLLQRLLPLVNKQDTLRFVKRKAFGDIVRTGRLQKGLSLRDLADRTGIDYSRLSRMETGTRPAPDLASLRELSRTLDLDLSDLLVAAGTAREVVDELLWSERQNVGDALPDVAAYRPGDSALLRKNTLSVSVTRRVGAQCEVGLGEEMLTVFSFSASENLSIEIPPEAVVVFRTDPALILGPRENVFAMRVRKVRRLGQITNLVLLGRGFTLNALEAATDERTPYEAADKVFAFVPAVAIRTRPADVGPDTAKGETD